jgi:hypothetical protein
VYGGMEVKSQYNLLTKDNIVRVCNCSHLLACEHTQL